MPARQEWPGTLTLQVKQDQDLRYGENPHQSAAFYVEAKKGEASVSTAIQLQGKELSYNNIADADAAWECVKSFDTPACVIVKHANPCGVAVAADTPGAYQQGLQDRPDPNRPSAASSPSTASWTATPPRPSSSASSSKC